MTTRYSKDSSSWELSPEPPYGYPDLESIIDHNIGYITPHNRSAQLAVKLIIDIIAPKSLRRRKINKATEALPLTCPNGKRR